MSPNPLVQYSPSPLALAFLLAILVAIPAQANCPTDTPSDCTVNEEFSGGRVELGALAGTYDIAGTETYMPWEEVPDVFEVSGSLTVELVDGTSANYLDVACDGTVTGQGKDRISGVVTRTPSSVGTWCPGGAPTGSSDGVGEWNVTIDRTYSISGSVTGTGEVELELSIDTADFTFENDSIFTWHIDCEWKEWVAGIAGIDLSGGTENIRLADADYDPMDGANWNPELTVLDANSWLEVVGRLFRVVAYPDGDGGLFSSPGLLTQEEFDEDFEVYQEANTIFFQPSVTATLTADIQGNAKVPVITEMVLEEPSTFLTDVAVDTDVTVTVDWRDSDAPQQIEFTYGSTSETVASGGDDTTWSFDAGEAGTTIIAKATSGSGDSQEWEIAVPKVAVPAWAGSASDWSGSGGVQYEATLDWPVSLETTQTIDSISLVTGLWGVSGSVTSEFNAKAKSDGSATSGDLETKASLKLAGKDFSFELTGTNSTTLSCDELTTEGDAMAQFPALEWQKTFNPVTAIPGLSSAVCGLSGALCNLINSLGPKGEVKASLSGSGSFSGEGSEITWEDGSLQGNLSAKISLEAVPGPLDKAISLGIEGGGSGCIEFQFSPEFELQTLGGEINVGAHASVFGLGVNPSHDWPFGDPCGGSLGAARARVGTGAGWVPADGQLAMAVSPSWGAAVWTELPAGQARPSGDIQVRIWDGTAWGAPFALTSDAESDMAPTARFDTLGRLVVVYQRSVETLPTMPAHLDTFANGFELHYAVIDPATATVTGTGALTSNSATDFGPTLRRDKIGDLHLFWQRANGAEVFGTATDSVSIHAASWSVSSSAFLAEETVATGLDFTLGWSAAAHDASEMLVGLLVDTDKDLSTGEDREIFQITKTADVWLSPVQVTSNAVLDDAPVAAFSASGSPTLLWRRGAQAFELRGDLAGTPALAFGSANPSVDEGLSSTLGEATVATVGAGLFLLWPEATQLQRVANDGPTATSPWSLAMDLAPSDRAQIALDLSILGNDAVVAYSEQAFLGSGGLDSMVTPKIENFSVRDEIFSDGFESGDTSSWSASVP